LALHKKEMAEKDDKRVEELARKKMEGKSYSEIRAGLSQSGLQPDEISSLIRKVDEKVLETATAKGITDKARQWYRAGLGLAVAGLIISIAYNAGLILKNLPALAVYSPFIAGILLMFYGRMMQRRQPRIRENSPGPIRRRRPYK
jgi:hypothetical protein